MADIWNSAHKLSINQIIASGQAGTAQSATTLVQLHENIYHDLQLPGSGERFLAHAHCLMLLELRTNWELDQWPSTDSTALKWAERQKERTHRNGATDNQQ